jgi:hypothetical protein
VILSNLSFAEKNRSNESGEILTSVNHEFSLDFYIDEMEPTKNDTDSMVLVFNVDVSGLIDCPTLVPTTVKCIIENHHNFDVDIFSILSDHLHSSFYFPTTIESNGTMIIQLTYLPSIQENLCTELQFVTSLGHHKQYVCLNSVMNVYKLFSFDSFQFIQGITDFEQKITLFNPHSEDLYIKEVYTSESFLSLIDTHMKDAGSECVKDVDNLNSVPCCSDRLWVVEPGCFKSIISVTVSPTLDVGRHRGFVHIFTDQVNFILPIDIEVLSGGIYSQPNLICFGSVTSLSVEKFVEVGLHNTGEEVVEILNISLKFHDLNLQVSVFDNTLLYPNQFETRVATVLYKPSVSGYYTNVLVIQTNHSTPLMKFIYIPCNVTVLLGGVGHEERDLIFVTHQLNSSCAKNETELSDVGGFLPLSVSSTQREISFISFFDSPVYFQNVLVSTCGDIFSVEQILHCNTEKVLNSFEKWHPVTIDFNQQLVDFYVSQFNNFLPKTCWIEVFTNVSSHRIPVRVIDGVVGLTFYAQVL